MSSDEKLELIRAAIQEWSGQQGHDRCWYYPDIFKRIADIAGVDVPAKPDIPRPEFEQGCRRFQDQEFGKDLQGE